MEGGVREFLFTTLATLWRMSSSGFRANLVPGIVLWTVGLFVVLTYYLLESSRGFFEAVMEIKRTYGFLYSFIATAFFGGFIPFLYLWAAGRINAGMVSRHVAFFVLYWGGRGIDVDAFYRLQSLLFGDDLNWTTIATKVFVDQFVYCTLWAAPITAVFYGWKDCDFSWSMFRKTTTTRSFLFEVARLLLSTWLVWIPATAIIYSLPQPLQVPLFSLTLCFFVLLVSVFFRKEGKS